MANLKRVGAVRSRRAAPTAKGRCLRAPWEGVLGLGRCPSGQMRELSGGGAAVLFRDSVPLRRWGSARDGTQAPGLSQRRRARPS